MKKILQFIYRLFRYTHYRKKLVREFTLHQQQNNLLQEQFESAVSKVIVFLVPGADVYTGKETISGGVISIVSIFEKTQLIYKNDKDVAVILCTPNDAFSLLKYNNFKNDAFVFRFNQVLKYFKNLTEMMVHVPDLYVYSFKDKLSKREQKKILDIGNLHINIMNQNIRLMPSPEEVSGLKTIANHITITTAHQQYCNQHYRQYFNVPLHKLSVWISPEKYTFKTYGQKQNLLVYSPDPHEEKERIIEKLSKIEGLSLQMIQGLTYEQYKETISNAKWALTFGEGLDGYLIEPIFSGAIGFAVYNEQFFTPDFKTLATLYPDYSTLQQSIVADIESLDKENTFNQYQLQQFEVCSNHYSDAVYTENIKKFYNKEYSYK